MVCCVKSCKDVRLRRLLPPDSEITFHRIPKARFGEFMKVIGFEGLKYFFLKTDFIISQNKRKFLTNCALPNSNLGGECNLNEMCIPGSSQYKRTLSTPQLGTSKDRIVTPVSFLPPSPKKARRVRKSSSSSTLTASSLELLEEDVVLQQKRWFNTIPSAGLVKICTFSEKYLKRLFFFNNHIPRDKRLLDSIVFSIYETLYLQLFQLFPQLEDHFMDFGFLEEHPVLLLKCIIL